MKKAVIWLMAMVICFSVAVAHGESLPLAAEALNMEALQRYPSYQENDKGRWAVRSNGADALLERFWDEGSDYSQSFLVFTVEAEGDSKTGIWQPVLRVYYAYPSKPLNATAISILADGIRYDLAAQSSIVENGKEKAEMISAPLTLEAVEMIAAVQNAGKVSMRLLGDSTYTTTFDAQSTTARKRLEAASLVALGDAAALLDQAGLENYGLWDRSNAAWKVNYGFAPLCMKSRVELALDGSEIDDEFGMIMKDQRSDASLKAQQALVSAGFLSGEPGKTFGTVAIAAVRRAQKYLGLVETGCADASLMRALTETKREATEENIEYSILEDAAGIQLNRYWFAQGVSAPYGADTARTSGNGDHLLLAADGWIINLSQEELRLFMHLDARVIYEDGYAFDATVVCERDGRSGLDISLLPMAKAPLLIYAEIPAHLAGEDEASWRIEISAREDTIKFDLE
ncbi:MAG: peptidoglycan-binding protein [Clostridiales bacterium]|nr:peptidoglycan-binding protein [Clostridiales bacterium]